MAYFERLGADSFRPTEHGSGAWDEREQHIGPALGLLTHVVERDAAERGSALATSRLSFDIHGTAPPEPMVARVEVLRPGRTIELVGASLACAGRTVVTLRAWRLRESPTADVAGTAFEPIPGPDDTPAWEPSTLWPGGYLDSVDARRALAEPGRGRSWVRSRVPLIDGEPVSPAAGAAALLDIVNGFATRVDPTELAYPNVDLTAHLFREPTGEWLGFDTRVTFGERGVGETHSVLHDEAGPLGSVAQILTLRRLGA